MIYSMRILVDMPEDQVATLNALAARAGTSRAEIIRQALDSYVEHHRKPIEAYFGLWADNPETQDVQGFLDRIRDEWEERFPTPTKP